jgi:heat shock protein HspQ
MLKASAKFTLGEVVRHRVHPFRGVIFDIDPTFSNTDEWWEAIPEENRPRKDQPFYHLLAENETAYYVAYVSEQNLVKDTSGDPVDHPEVASMFGTLREGGRYDVGGGLH